MFNFLNISDAKGLVPVALAALIGVGVWYLVVRARAQQQQNNLANSETGLTSGGAVNAGDLALIETLLAANSAPGTQAQNVTSGGFGNAPAAQPITTNSSIAPQPVTQGAA